MTPRARAKLWDLGLLSIKDLETPQGILASGRSEAYGCIFGRDSLITALKLLRAHEKTKSEYFLHLAKKIILNIADLQGSKITIESGEEPGKIIHEYRPEGHEHLTKSAREPWFLYPDNVMRNYDSVDSTPLFLMAAHAYYAASADQEFARLIEPAVRRALQWIMVCGDTNGDGFIDYEFNPKRQFGGLRTQSWMDSAESVFFENYDEKPSYPIAPVEAQAYTYAALRAWANYFAASDEQLSKELGKQADSLKEKFNQAFVLHGRGNSISLAFAIDGNKRPLTSVRSSMGHVLWASPKDNISRVGVAAAGVRKSVIKKVLGGSQTIFADTFSPPDSILDIKYIPAIVHRLLQPDLYVRNAGIRTLSSRSKRFDPRSYHNGSIWPHDTTIVAAGLENFGYAEEARQVRESILKAYAHFETPIELFVYANRKFGEYIGPTGQKACREQAWSAASLLAMLDGESS